MTITPEVEAWLRDEGRYEYHSFVSWPRTINPHITECARQVRKAIEERLALSFDRPRVFLDESDIVGGDIWENKMKAALCRSISMVAICAPIYYHPAHPWCGREWAAMQSLGSCRLQGKNISPIIPIMVRKPDVLPDAVSAIQFIDFRNLTIKERRFFRAQEFTFKVQEIVLRIEELSGEIWRSKSRADCEQFAFPEESAFLGYGVATPVFPLIGK